MPTLGVSRKGAKGQGLSARDKHRAWSIGHEAEHLRRVGGQRVEVGGEGRDSRQLAAGCRQNMEDGGWEKGGIRLPGLSVIGNTLLEER